MTIGFIIAVSRQSLPSSRALVCRAKGAQQPMLRDQAVICKDPIAQLCRARFTDVAAEIAENMAPVFGSAG